MEAAGGLRGGAVGIVRRGLIDYRLRETVGGVGCRAAELTATEYDALYELAVHASRALSHSSPFSACTGLI